MKVTEKNFREIYKKICFLKNSGLVEKIDLHDVFDYPPEENLNGFVTYAFINLNHEFVFEILAGAKISVDACALPSPNKCDIFCGKIIDEQSCKLAE